MNQNRGSNPINSKSLKSTNPIGGMPKKVVDNVHSVDNSSDSLPKQFVQAMRTLFDIMDDQKTGYISLSDIEHRWQDDGSEGMPKGVIECLRKVTPSNGLLSFERFCGGLKICLLQNQSSDAKARSRNLPRSSATASSSGSSKEEFKKQRPPSVPLLDLENAIPCPQWNYNNTAAVRPNNAMPVTRTHSLPKLSPDSELDMLESPTTISLYAPPKPPRTQAGLERSAATVSNNMDRLDKAEIRHALQNWQMGVLMNEMDAKDKRKVSTNPQVPIRKSVDGVSSTDNGPPPPLFQKKSNARRREPRRHTLQNGVDYNMLKRLKHFEQEKDVLFQGLNALERAREWYLNKISEIQERIKYLGRVGAYTEPWSEAQQERLDLQRARVMEVNRHLSVLAESWERSGFPMHMNLAVRHQKPQPLAYHHEVVNRLKQQNQQLSVEVRQKNERVSILERERQNLIKELVQLQRFKPSGDETLVF